MTALFATYPFLAPVAWVLSIVAAAAVVERTQRPESDPHWLGILLASLALGGLYVFQDAWEPHGFFQRIAYYTGFVTSMGFGIVLVCDLYDNVTALFKRQ